ncbi:hypothetical protein [Corallococcus sp. M7]
MSASTFESNARLSRSGPSFITRIERLMALSAFILESDAHPSRRGPGFITRIGRANP